VVGPTVIEMARAAVRRIADAAPAAKDALAALDQIERAGVGPPYTVAIAGDHAARTALLNCLAGEHLFDPTRHDPARVMMTLQRGSITALRARRRDGSVEERTLGAMLAVGGQAVAIALHAEVVRHGTWLEAELARERVAIDAERARLAGLAIVRDTATADQRELVAALDALTAELP